MKFNITSKTIANEIRNYIALGFTFVGYILYFPTAICTTIARHIKVD